MAGTKNAKQARATASTQPAGHAGKKQHSDQPKRVPPALVIDAAALGRLNHFEDRVIFLADWLEARAFCSCPLEDQHLGPCVPQKTRWVPTLDAELRIVGVHAERYDPRERTARYRQTFPEDLHPDRQDPFSSSWDRRRGALDRTHQLCDQSEKWLVASDLSRQRPGAREPWEDCSGCCFSYLGELEHDRSILSAYGVTPEELPHQRVPVRYADVVEKRQQERERRRRELEKLRQRSLPTPGKAEPRPAKEPKPKRKRGARR